MRLLIIYLFSTELTDGLSFHEDIGVREGTEGGNISVGCSFKFSGRRKVFCRNDCKDGDILCETTDVSAQCGRYSIKLGLNNAFYVSITNLRKSDSGSYKCWSSVVFGSESFHPHRHIISHPADVLQEEGQRTKGEATGNTHTHGTGSGRHLYIILHL
uniref:Immunoglobulin subtype domain-containing protein n=2 Tax=Labrus bergylta TaxID=56723 RepID=A0A3Q3EDT2_9LABR